MEITDWITATATFFIALATGLYTFFSRKTLKEVVNQNQFLIKKEEEKYKLERKALSKELLQEINLNELILDYLSFLCAKDINVINGKSVRDFTFFNVDRYKGIIDDFENDSYRNFIRSGIDFKSDELILEVKELYFDLYFDVDSIKSLLAYVIRLKEVKLEDKEKHIREWLDKIYKNSNEMLKKIKKLYKEFSKEIGYDYRNSKFYKKHRKIEYIYF